MLARKVEQWKGQIEGGGREGDKLVALGTMVEMGVKTVKLEGRDGEQKR